MVGIEGRTLTTAEELIDFLDSHSTSVKLNFQEAQILLGYMKGHGYALEECDGKLIRTDWNSNHGQTEYEEYTIDDAIDTACEWNYELLQEAKQAKENAKDLIDFTSKDNNYQSLRADEKILDQMFDRTKYGKEVMELAEKLADEFIQNLENKKDMEEAVKILTDDVTQSRTDKRER